LGAFLNTKTEFLYTQLIEEYRTIPLVLRSEFKEFCSQADDLLSENLSRRQIRETFSGMSLYHAVATQKPEGGLRKISYHELSTGKDVEESVPCECENTSSQGLYSTELTAAEREAERMDSILFPAEEKPWA
jgi:hypothetical protein